MSDTRAAHWSHFWQQGYITTFGASLPNNYQGTVAEFWRTRFRQLRAGDRLLDIATGNGALACLAAQVSAENRLKLQICATDLAAIQPPDNAWPSSEQITFISHTPCEQQPFENQSFDLICSQFGFEYSACHSSLAEAARLLKPGGHFVAICHFDTSGIIQQARRDLALYQFALHEQRLFNKLSSYFEHPPQAGGGATPSPQAQAFNSAMNAVIKHFGKQESGRELIAGISHLVRQAAGQSGNERLQAVATLQQEFQLASLRLRDMVEAALAPQTLEKLQQSAQQLGFETKVSKEITDHAGDLIGWLLDYRNRNGG